MRALHVSFVLTLLAACSGDSREPADFSGEAARNAEQQARQRCAGEGKRAQLQNVFENTDGSRRYEYRCVQ